MKILSKQNLCKRDRKHVVPKIIIRKCLIRFNACSATMLGIKKGSTISVGIDEQNRIAMKADPIPDPSSFNVSINGSYCVVCSTSLCRALLGDRAKADTQVEYLLEKSDTDEGWYILKEIK